MVEKKVRYRLKGAHSQNQRRLGESGVSLTLNVLGVGEREGNPVQQPGAQRYKRAGNQNVWII